MGRNLKQRNLKESLENREGTLVRLATDESRDQKQQQNIKNKSKCYCTERDELVH